MLIHLQNPYPYLWQWKHFKPSANCQCHYCAVCTRHRESTNSFLFYHKISFLQ